MVVTDENDESSSSDRDFLRSAEADRLDLAFRKLVGAAGGNFACPNQAADTLEPPGDGEHDSSSAARPSVEAARRAPAAALHDSTHAVPQKRVTAGGRRRSIIAQSSNKSRTRPSVPPRAHLAGRTGRHDA
jgi:hypothetical protein